MDTERLKQEIDSLVEDMNCLIDLADLIKLKVDTLSLKVNESPKKSEIEIPTLKEMLQSIPDYDKPPEQKRKGWVQVDPLGGVNFCWQQIPIRARRVLKYYKIRKPIQLRNLTVKQIKRIDNAGPATVEAIRELCDKYAVTLKDS